MTTPLAWTNIIGRYPRPATVEEIKAGHRSQPQTGSSKATLPPGKAAATAPKPEHVFDQLPPPTARAEAWGEGEREREASGR